MSKEGMAKCKECGREIEGMFPDSKSPGLQYNTVYDKMDPNLVSQLEKHHLDTRAGSLLLRWLANEAHGHMEFDVFLEDGTQGKLSTSGYYILYRELVGAS